jgi:serine/threonine protein kinase
LSRAPTASKLAEQHGGHLSYEHGISIISQALDALSFAHALGYIHRDFKDQNILVGGPLSEPGRKVD